MTAKIKTPIGEAIIDGYKWQSDNKNLESFLNSLLSKDGPSGADPNPDLNAALVALTELGLSEDNLIMYDEVKRDPAPGVYY